VHHAGFVSTLGETVLVLLAPALGERVLDLGCGDGTLAERICAAGAQVVCVDSAPSMVEAARARGFDARMMDGQALDFVHEFDAVFSNAALHWMPRADAVIAGVARALRPGGRFVAEFGAHGNVAAVTTALRAVVARRGGNTLKWSWFFPTPSEYKLRLEAAGFIVEEITTTPRPTPLPTGMAGWLEMFAQAALAELSAEEAAAARAEAIELLRPALCDSSGNWTAEYVRLRFRARLPAAS
jgi:SAM-dependent methyltransferase